MNRELYQDIILEHFRAPRHRKSLQEGDVGVFSIRNPNCGDLVKLFLQPEGNGGWTWLQDAQGCAASVASTSILCEQLNGRSTGEAKRVIATFLAHLEDPSDADGISGLEACLELEALAYFRNVPARKLCVSLAWTCAQNALAAQG